MINRRELIIGGACVAAAAGAEVIRPHRHISLLGDTKLEAAIPKAFGQWKVREDQGIVTPEEENSLAAKLYNQTVGRSYATPGGDTVMMLIAYGNTQSDTLQLHRPEVCYPAFGFDVTQTKTTEIALGERVYVPGRALVASQPGREERITYWTRIGEYLPTDNTQQRKMRFETALAGIIPDGVLVRLSNYGVDDGAFELNQRFAADLLAAVPAAVRPALITTDKARLLSASGRA